MLLDQLTELVRVSIGGPTRWRPPSTWTGTRGGGQLVRQWVRKGAAQEGQKGAEFDAEHLDKQHSV